MMHVAGWEWLWVGGGIVFQHVCIEFKWSDTSGSPPNFLARHSSLALHE